jgi:hypothetical protein
MLPVAGGGAQSDDWNAFQSPAPQQQQPQAPAPYMNAFGGGAAAQPQAQGFMGGGGYMAGQQPQAQNWGAMQAPMGMHAGNPGFQMGQNAMAPQVGYGAAFGGGMVSGMPGMGMGAASPQQMQQQQMQQQQQQWANRGGMMPNAAPGGAAGTGVPGMGQQQPGGNNVDDLLSKAMDGVATMSFEQRKGPAMSMPTQNNVPMGMMQQAPRGW